jgi:hypothetical protein
MEHNNVMNVQSALQQDYYLRSLKWVQMNGMP